MRSIGIRLSPSCAYYSIIEKNNKDEFNLLDNSNLIIPQSAEFPFQLSFLRTNIFSIIQEFKINNAGLRITESVAYTPSIKRINMEGVIQELLCDSNINNYFAGRITKIASILEEDKTVIKKAMKGEINIFDLDNWNDLKNEERESFIVGLAASFLKEDDLIGNT